VTSCVPRPLSALQTGVGDIASNIDAALVSRGDWKMAYDIWVGVNMEVQVAGLYTFCETH